MSMPPESMLRFDVFGRAVGVQSTPSGWSVFYLSADGKRRPAEDIRIPAAVQHDEILRYLADLCHEWADYEHPDVRKLK